MSAFSDWWQQTCRRSDVAKLVCCIVRKFSGDTVKHQSQGNDKAQSQPYCPDSFVYDVESPKNSTIDNSDAYEKPACSGGHFNNPEYPRPYEEVADQLGQTNMDVRLAAVDALSCIAREQPDDHWAIMTLLADFIRKSTKDGLKLKPDADVQAALTVIGKRNTQYDDGQSIDLQGANLSGADLRGGNFEKVNFMRANLTNVVFEQGEAQSTVFFSSSLAKGNFQSANLTGARFMQIDFSGADFTNADLSDARLVRSNCKDAVFKNITADKAVFMETDFTNADFRGANLKTVKNLTSKQISAAKTGPMTQLPAGL